MSSQSQGGNQATGLSTSAAQLIRSHLHAAKQLPEPGREFYARELPADAREMFARFRENDLVEQVGRDRDSETYRWQVRPVVADAVRRFESEVTPGTRVTPCCHVESFQNLRDGDYSCGRCNTEFDEFETVEEVADGE
jgi:hypothetical protein